MTDNKRRFDDNIDNDTRNKIFEIAETMSRTYQRLDDHVKWAENSHAEQKKFIEGLDVRVKEVEEFHGRVKLLKWPLVTVATPTFAWIGIVISEKLAKIIFKHVP